MIQYLLDTNVISETRKPRAHGGVTAWLDLMGKDSFAMPGIVVGEIQAGLESTRRQDLEKATEIEAWLEGILTVVPVVAADAKIFRRSSILRARHKSLQYADALIAATALELGCGLATRNLKDFAGLGIPVVNPFEYRSL